MRGILQRRHVSPARGAKESRACHASLRPRTGRRVRECGPKELVTANHVIVDETNGDLVHPHLCGQRFTGSSFEGFELAVIKRLRIAGKGPDIAILRVVRDSSEPLSFVEIGPTPTVGADVFIAGFPLVFDQVYPYPLVRRGAVASTRYQYDDEPIIVLDITGVSGFSGSPVVDAGTDAVVGVFRGTSEAHPETNFSAAFALDRQKLKDHE